MNIGCKLLFVYSWFIASGIFFTGFISLLVCAELFGCCYLYNSMI